MTDFEGKVVLINGGTRGLGAEIAQQAAALGAKVIITGRTKHQGEEVVGKVGSDRALYVQMDCTVEKEIISLHEQIQSNPDFGGFDFVVNNLGVEDSPPSPIDTCTEESYERCMNAKVKSAFLGMKHQIQHFKRRNVAGSVVNVSSMIGLGGHAMVPAYSAANGAVQALTKSVACEVGGFGIRVNAICPGAIKDTPMLHRFTGGSDGSSSPATEGHLYSAYLENESKKYPMARLPEVSEVAKAALFLLSKESSMITGHCLPVEGGYVMSL